jgi:D-alanyl-D-alanine carboxypeptidase
VGPGSLAPMPSLVSPAASPAAQVSAAKTAMRQQLPSAQAEAPTVVASAEPATASIAAPAKTEPAKVEVAKAEPAKIEVAKAEPVKVEVAKAEPVKADPPRAELARSEPDPAPVRAHGGWLIQIGAFDAEDEAKQHLSAAQSKLHAQLAAADPFTERVQKGDKQLYRARFAGFDKETAEATCKQLKRNDFECMALKN